MDGVQTIKLVRGNVVAHPSITIPLVFKNTHNHITSHSREGGLDVLDQLDSLLPGLSREANDLRPRLAEVGACHCLG